MKDAILTILGIIMYYTKYKRFPDIKDEKIKKIQFKKIKKLLIKCKEVPYYKELFQSIPFNPQKDFNSLSDLNFIPVLKKETVRANPELFINQKYFKKALTFKTSGTTGIPFCAYVSPNHWIIEQAVIWRHWKWAGFNLFDAMAIIRSHNPKNDADIIKVDKFRNWIYYSPYHLNDKYMEIFYKDMLNRKIRFLRGYPSSLSLFAEFCSRKGYVLPSLKACFTASEILTDKERTEIESAFGIKVFDHYGLAEAIVMMHNKGEKGKYFNCEEYGYLELIPSDTAALFKIIGTNLNNYAMPLIRYDTDDTAEVQMEENGHKYVKNILGRKDICIQTKTVKIPTVNLYTTLYKVEGIVQWQIIQNDLDSLDIYLKIKEGLIFNEITHKIDQLNKTALIFNYHQTKVFTLVGEGKLKPYISNL
ncbi:MAG: hypothetical protein WCO13_11205 [Bacteroidota bacterium]